MEPTWKLCHRWLMSTFLAFFVALIYLALVVWNAVKLTFQFPPYRGSVHVFQTNLLYYHDKVSPTYLEE